MDRRGPFQETLAVVRGKAWRSADSRAVDLPEDLALQWPEQLSVPARRLGWQGITAPASRASVRGLGSWLRSGPRSQPPWRPHRSGRTRCFARVVGCRSVLMPCGVWRRQAGWGSVA